MSMLRVTLRKVGHSLSARLVLIFVAAMFAWWFATEYAISLFQDTDYLRRIAGAHTVLHTDYILKDIGSPPDIEKAQKIVNRIPVDIRIKGPEVDWSSTPDFYPLDDIPFGPLSWLELGAASAAGLEEWAQDLEKIRFARYKGHSLIKINDQGHDIVFASPRIREVHAQPNIRLIIFLTGVGVLSLMYLAVRWVFLPIVWMQEGAKRIGQGDLDYRIPTPRNDELGDLSRDINEMADDVQGMLEAKRQLMLAISHELRSPLTRSKVALALIEDDATRATLLEDIDEMERLITDILESEALNTRHAILRREQVNLEELVQSVIEVDFASRNTDIAVDVQEGLPLVNLDSTRMRLLLRNLIDNALRYNPEDADPVCVSVRQADQFIDLSVKDHGPGIPPEHVEHVTEPFYRADPARARATGGFGLGLYLCRLIVEAHDGVINVHSLQDQGTTLMVRLPANTD
ncbi:MAG: sensor histidine kinase [Gammaproteobacteria bacterium]